MDSLPHDFLAIILAKTPLKSIATSKLVCKQWKSILESKFFYHLFQSHHQNSHSLWSLMCSKSHKEVMAHYRCNNWGLTRFLGSYISSFITSSFLTEKNKIESYSDAGLMLISLANPGSWYPTYYMANPISREYVRIPPIIPCINWLKFTTFGLVTQLENDIVLSYKIVLVKFVDIGKFEYDICFLLYSSETGLWSFITIRCPFCYMYDRPISLNGNLYWFGLPYTLEKRVLVYHNFYATGTESDRCGVIPFPGVKNYNLFRGVCAISQGSLMYMNIVFEDKDGGSSEHKLRVWRLKNGEWQIVSEMSPEFINPGVDHFQFTINPFDAKTVYLWSKEQKKLASINLDTCKIGLHNNFGCGSGDNCVQTISEEWYLWEGFCDRLLHMVYLPRWLYRIPCSPS